VAGCAEVVAVEVVYTAPLAHCNLLALEVVVFGDAGIGLEATASAVNSPKL